MSVEKSITYFDKLGKENTEVTIRAARKRAEELKIRDIVVASTRGNVGLKAAEFFRGYNAVVVARALACP